MEASQSSKKKTDSTLDIIKKPRVNYSNTILRRTQPANVDILKKMQSITMAKLRVFTFLHLKKEGEEHFRKVRTVDNIPKILTIISGKKQRKKSSNQVAMIQSGIEEVDNDDDSKPDKHCMLSGQDDDFGGSSDSSIDGGMDEFDAKML